MNNSDFCVKMEGASFKSLFYQLQGDALKERHKNFFKLLKSTDFSISDDQLDVTPRNFLEEMYRVEAFIYFRRANLLLKVFKSGNESFVSKILKQEWFFREIFKDMEGNTLVHEILPTYSYSLRMKVLTRLSKILTEQQMDKVFDLILLRYGKFIAIRFLARCSEEKIEYFLKNNEVQLAAVQLKIIFNKNPQLLMTYLEEYKRNFGRDYYEEQLFVYVTQKNPELALKLREKFSVCPKLGKRTTKNFIKAQEQQIVGDITKMIDTLHKPTAVRYIKQFDKLITKFFPGDIKALNRRSVNKGIFDLIKSYPRVRRWDIFSRSFSVTYHYDLIESLIHFDRDVMKFAPTSVIQKWAEIKYKETDNIDFIKYQDPQKAIPIIKEKIQFTSSVSDRQVLLHLLIDTCLECRDWKGLEEVLKYICFRHRNEQNTRTHILYKLKANADFDELNQNHWKYIMELLELHRIRNEYGFPTNFDLYYRYIEYLFKNNQKNNEVLLQYMKDVAKLDAFPFIDDTKDDLTSKHILEYMADTLFHSNLENKFSITIKLFNEIIDNNDKQKYFIQASRFPVFVNLAKEIFSKTAFKKEENLFLSSVLRYNEQDPKNPFKLPSDEVLLQIVKTSCLHSDLLCRRISDMVKKQTRNRFEEQLVELYFSSDILARCICLGLTKSVIHVFLRNEPQTIVKYYNAIMSQCFQWGLYNEIVLIKKYAYLNLDRRLIDHLKTCNDIEKVKVYKTLSILMPIDEFLMFIEEYSPQSIKLDLNDKIQKELYTLQCSIIKSVSTVSEPSKVISFVMKFCQGDYLQESLPTLYSIMYRIPENEVSTQIGILAGRAVSVRKHALFLCCELLPLSKVEEMYSKTLTIEKNASNLKYWFSSVFKYFVKNSSNNIFDFVILNLSNVNENDNELMQLISNKPQIPKKYLPAYVEKVWDFFESLKIKGSLSKDNVEQYQAALLNTINIEVLAKLDKNYCKSVIEKYFLAEGRLNYQINSFVTQFLQVYTNDDHFEYIFEILRAYKRKHWNSDDKKPILTLFRFFGFQYEIDNISFITLFKQHWERLFTEIESFEEYLLLKLMVIYRENEFSLESFASKANIIFEKITETYGLHVMNLASRAISHFFSSVPNININLMGFIYHLVSVKPSPGNCFLAALLLQNNNVSVYDDKEYVRDILEIMKNVQEPVVQMEYYKCLQRD